MTSGPIGGAPGIDISIDLPQPVDKIAALHQKLGELWPDSNLVATQTGRARIEIPAE